MTGSRLWITLIGLPLMVACAWTNMGTQTPARPSIPTLISNEAGASPTLSPDNMLNYNSDYWDILIPGIYHLYGSTYFDDLVTITFTNQGTIPLRVKAEAQVEGYTDWAVGTVTVAPGERDAVNLHPVLQPQSIDQLTSLRQANLRLRITLLAPQNTTLEDTTDTITIYARRDFPWNLWRLIDDFDEHNNNMLLAAWVTPNDPAIEAWIREAANYTDNGDMPSGYNHDVHDRLEALWDALAKAYNIAYVSTSVNMGSPEEKDLFFQRIRFPREVLNQESANCIETTLLWASAAEALRLHPYIILVPGHAYVAIDSVPDGSRAFFIETTLIGSGDFDDAVRLGGEEWDKDKESIDEQEEYDMIDIWEAREQGILPMPWH